MKLKCPVCDYEGHNLKTHFKDGPQPACRLTSEEFEQEFPRAVIFSDELFAQLEKVRGYGLTPTSYDSMQLFGIPFGKDNLIPGFAEMSERVPQLIPDFVFHEEYLKCILVALTYNKPAMFVGPTGCGKTDMLRQVAARIRWPIIRINHHRDVYEHNIVGQKIVVNKSTEFEYGPLPTAMKGPHILILDEWDSLLPEIAFLYQPVLERGADGRLGDLCVTSNGGEVISSHQFFRVFATSNTNGIMDEKGIYAGTNVQNYAFINRFLLKKKIDYLPESTEGHILKLKYPDLREEEISAFTKTSKLIREQFQSGNLNTPFSIRDLINWVDFYVNIVGGDAAKAVRYAYTDILPYEDTKVIEELILKNFK